MKLCYARIPTIVLLIQLLGNQWDKKGRNIEATRKRAAAPTVQSFQTLELPNFGECWIQGFDVRRVEWTDYVSAGLVEALRLNEEEVRVGLSARHDRASIDRIEQGRPFTLKLGETAQFFAQYRCQSYEDVWFERDVVNVAWLTRFDSEVFRLRPFTYEFHFRAPLAQ